MNSNMRRYIVIIGAMKSGTTTLFDTLARHPAIAPAWHKEPGFFAFEDVWERGFEWFDTLFEFDPAQHEYRMEASTDYTKAPFVTGVWERMTAHEDVEVKLLYIMRHPFRRLESHAKHTERHKREVGNEFSPRPSHSLDAGLSAVSLATSAYASQLAYFEEARARGNLHCLTLEALKNDPETTMAQIWTFLGLEPHEIGDKIEASNAADTKMRVNPLWAKLTQVKPLLAVGKAVLPNGIRAQIRDKFRKEKSSVEGRFKLNDSETVMLETLYREELARLRDVYKVDISPWNT